MKRRVFLGSVGATCVAPEVLATELAYPVRPVKILNPFPGGPTDAAGRLIAKKLFEGLGQPFVIDNRPGAGGVTALSAAAKAPADGYTLLVTSSSTHLYQPVIRKSLPYDIKNDFIPIWLPGQSTFMVVINADLPFRTLADLVAYGRANPGKLNYGSSGLGTALHIAGEVFGSVTGAKMVHVPYRGASNAMTDLVGGQVQVMFDSPTNSAPNIRSGKIRALAIMSDSRWSTLPDVPTTAELGWPGIEMHSWFALFAPAQTPSAIIERITATLKSASQDAEVIKYFETTGIPLRPEFGRAAEVTINRQRDALAAVVQKAGLQPVDD
jgi:tripartite-type tricarboxylate transporter receptor subunit TctC